MKTKKEKELTWRKLDNTANIYPVISSNQLSGVYRLAVVLKEEVCPELLQQALNRVLGWFDGFRVRLRRGVFWYYYETNRKQLRVKEEYACPCRYIDPYRNNEYPLRVSYYKNKINVEFFHALTDGYGAVNFVRELTAQYLRLAHPELGYEALKGEEEKGKSGEETDRKAAEPLSDSSCKAAEPLSDTSFSVEDAYIKYYKKQNAKGYGAIHAYALKDDPLTEPITGVVHEYIEIASLKRAAKSYGSSITQYLTAVLLEGIYKEYWKREEAKHGRAEKGGEKIRINIPVNLRQFFPSETTLNFFGVIFAELEVLEAEKEKGGLTFEEILRQVQKSFSDQLTKEHMEYLISYNVSNEKNPFVRAFPLFIKNIGIKLIYNRSSKAFTTTLSNVGQIKMPEELEPYIENFHLIMGVSKKQPLKCVACSYQGRMTLTISSVFRNERLGAYLCERLREDQVEVSMEDNGVYSKEKADIYPKIAFNPQFYHQIVWIAALVSVIIGALLIEINVLTGTRIWWSLISAGVMAYSWMTMLFSIRNYTNPAAKILVQTLGAMALCVLIDFGTGYRGWSVNFAAPGIILAADLGTLALMLVHFKSWQSYLLFQIEYAGFSLIPLLLYFLGVVTKPVLAVVSIAVSWLLLLASILFGRKKAETELKRRFRI